jgi:hypothetical protein
MADVTTDNDDSSWAWLDKALDSVGDIFVNAGQNALTYAQTPQGAVRLGSMGLAAIGANSSLNQPQIQPTGYQGGIPALSALRRQVPQMMWEEMSDGSIRPQGPRPQGYPTQGIPAVGTGGTKTKDSTYDNSKPQMGYSNTGGIEGLLGPQGTGRQVPMMYDPNRRPGSSGRRYFTDTQYLNQDSDRSAAGARMESQAADLAKANVNNLARQSRPEPKQMAVGGLAELEKGAYLNGSTDGMSDEVPARIDGRQEARLSDGEFVIPADVVSHLGNGNSDAGAKVLQRMMGRVREERTGNKKQGKEIRPKNLLPV